LEWQQREAERLDLAVAGCRLKVDLQIQAAGDMEQRN
jgi:hypothetical protein